MKIKEVRPYYESLEKKKVSLYLKRIFDVIISLTMLLLLFPLMIVISVLIMTDSKGGIFYCQERVTQYGKIFKIIKFRTMVVNAEKLGTRITAQNDSRITRVGEKLRKYRLDELPQLVNILFGDMTLVGTRPESVYYVKSYTPEMFATLLLPAGVTSEASIRYKDEAKLLKDAKNIDTVYVKKILPDKMIYNLKSIRQFSLFKEISTIFKTVLAILGKEYV